MVCPLPRSGLHMKKSVSEGLVKAGGGIVIERPRSTSSGSCEGAGCFEDLVDEREKEFDMKLKPLRTLGVNIDGPGLSGKHFCTIISR